MYLDRGAPGTGGSLTVADADGTSPARITTLPARAAGGAVTVSATDHVVQEGARRFTVTGRGATIAVEPQAPLDITRQSNGDVLLVTTVRRDTALAGTATIGMRTGDRLATLPLPQLAALPLGQWKTLAVPLKCFAGAGADLAKVNAPFVLTLGGTGTISLSRVALGMVADQTVACAK